MAGQFEATVEIDRPIGEVFAFLADGRNDKKFSPRVLEMTRTPDAPTTVGTVYRSTVKDAGMKTRRQFRISEFEPPTRIRWNETSKNLVTVVEGGYDLEATDDGRTKVRIYNELQGNGLGKLLAGVAVGAARKDAPDFGRRIKKAVEGS